MQKKILNLGCGQRYHEDWTNVDFYSDDKNIISTNLLKGIPFPNGTFDVVYHSHVLEHFSKNDGVNFIKECYRVLKPGGILRVVIPDLGGIIKEYNRLFTALENGKNEFEADYDWILLELFDQMVRNYSGGEMAKYLTQKKISNEKFVSLRMGEAFGNFRTAFTKQDTGVVTKKITIKKIINWLKKHVPFQAYRIGHFRQSGEIHQWMYDSYSLKRLLNNCGFINTEIMEPNTSRVNNWNSYGLDYKNGIVYKADSLFMEANKPILLQA